VDVAIAAVAAAATALIVMVSAQRLGSASLFIPLALVALVIVLFRPMLAVGLAVVLAALCEGPAFGLFPFTEHLYDQIYKTITPLDLLVLLAGLSVALDLLRKRRAPYLPRALMFPLGLLLLAMLSGVVVGHGNGVSVKSAVLAENVPAYLLILPISVANLEADRRTLRLMLGGLFALAGLKALLGLAELASGRGISIEGTSTLTYYEPTANWLIMVAVLGIFTAFVARMRPPLWMVLSAPLLIASLVLSYRRSFWIATVLGVLLVLVLALSPVGRRLLVPVVVFVALAIWVLGSVSFQSQSPIVRRAESLSPTSLKTNVEDRYRLDERANVVAEIERHPISGNGTLVPWQASTQGLSIEHVGGRDYVHFAALWFWLKFGILGLFAYIAVVAASAQLGWRVWRRSHDPLFRAFGLASLCAFTGLLAAETTASFTGVDLRFTVLFGTQVGLLALLRRRAMFERV
jgi:O-antigen ligase